MNPSTVLPSGIVRRDVPGASVTQAHVTLTLLFPGSAADLLKRSHITGFASNACTFAPDARHAGTAPKLQNPTLAPMSNKSPPLVINGTQISKNSGSKRPEIRWP